MLEILGICKCHKHLCESEESIGRLRFWHAATSVANTELRALNCAASSFLHSVHHVSASTMLVEHQWRASVLCS